MQLARHTLRIADPGRSLPFYENVLGMKVLEQRLSGDATHYLLGFFPQGQHADTRTLDSLQSQSGCFLELVHDSVQPAAEVRRQPDTHEGYWKIALSVADLEIAHAKLIAKGVTPDEPRQVGDIAYLCHLNDPDGYCVELIQHDFKQNHTGMAEDSRYPLGTSTSFLLITYRIKDASTSLEFYTGALGMRLLSKQCVAARNFTLYFLAYSDEPLPVADVEHVDNREWLWQRPYAMVELQHIWGTEADDAFAYRVGPESGFIGIGIKAENLDRLLNQLDERGCETELGANDPATRARTAIVKDPDGFSIRLIDRGTSG